MSTHTIYETSRAQDASPAPYGDIDQPQPRLLVAPSRGQELGGLLGAMARIYHLDVHGTSLLTRRAATEMGYVALMLTIIFVFDLAAWTLLWNMIFHAGKMHLGWLTPVAIFCGLIFAAMIFIYERQFMTADTHGRWRKVWWPITIRLIVIAVAAAITTQPVEVMVFQGPIERRIHEESVRVEALSRLRDLKEAKERSRGATGLIGTVEYSSFQSSEQKSEQARKEASALRAERSAQEASLRSAQDSLRSAQTARARARTPGEVARANGRIQSASKRIEQARDRIGSIAAELKGSEDNEKYWNEQEKTARTQMQNKQQSAEGEVQRLQDWIAQIRKGAPGRTIYEDTGNPQKWQFQDQEYDFFQRLGIINDLYYGRSARWPDATAEDRKELSEEYGLKDAGGDDQEAEARRLADAHTFQWSYWAVVGIAAVIPLLVLALKGLLPRDLKVYYSTREQRGAGNYESLKFTSDHGQLSASINVDPS